MATPTKVTTFHIYYAAVQSVCSVDVPLLIFFLTDGLEFPAFT